MDKTLIIAEAGVNHNGSLAIAKQLVNAAKECGADVIKFQTFNLDMLVSKHAKMAEYQKRNIGEEESQKEMLSKLCLSYNEFEEIANYCKEIGIGFLSTPFDIDSVHFLDSLQEVWKVPSGEITNYPYLVEIGKTRKTVILSTGMCNMQEIEEAITVLKSNGTEEIIILHCTTEYPAPVAEVNLNVMNTLREKFGFPVGYSDHTKGITIALTAVAMGAKVIEKHFTLDKMMQGPDHKASLEPNELKEMVDGIRMIELAKGDGIKEPTISEAKNREVARKSIVATRDIKAGEEFSAENLTTKRPGSGISPMRWNDIIGMNAPRNFEKDEVLEL